MKPAPALRLTAPSWILFVVVLGLLQCAHLVARGQAWKIDAEWAVQFYLFSMVFFGPAVAGLAAWSAVSLTRLNWLSRMGSWRGIRALAGTGLALALLVFLLGLVVALGWVWSAGAPLGTASGAVGDVAVAVVGICGYWAFGLAVGAYFPNRLIPAVAAALTFGLTMALWIGGLASAVQFGVTGGGGFGLSTSTAVQMSRLLLWGGIALAGVLLVRARMHPASKKLVPAAAIAAAASLAGLVSGATTDDIFKVRPQTFECTGRSPQTCVPTRSAWLLPEVTSAVAQQGLARQIAQTSPNASDRFYVDVPQVLSQASAYGGGSLSPELAESLGALARDLYAPGCLTVLDPEAEPVDMPRDAQRASDRISTWIIEQTAVDGYVPKSRRDMTIGSAQAQAFLAENLDRLPPCPD